jgi:hypothetical protein
MRDSRPRQTPPSALQSNYPASIPADQIHAVDRRHALNQQQRLFGRDSSWESQTQKARPPG